MADDRAPERLLTESEVSFLLRRSAQLQRQEAQALVESQTAGVDDLTLSDLEEITDEIGSTRTTSSAPRRSSVESSSPA